MRKSALYSTSKARATSAPDLELLERGSLLLGAHGISNGQKHATRDYKWLRPCAAQHAAQHRAVREPVAGQCAVSAPEEA